MHAMRTFAWAFVFTATAALAFAEPPRDFTVESPLDGSTFKLSDQQGKVVAIHFLLKTECPYCLRYTRDYALLAAKSPEVVHLFLKPDSAAEIKAWASKLDEKAAAAAPRLYRDADAKLASAFDIPDGYRFHGQSVHYPAVVVLGGDGKELFRYVGKSNADRLSVKDFQTKLTEAQKAAQK